MDAFFQRDIFRLLTARRCAYAIKVGYWSWLPLKQLAAERQRCLPVAPNVAGFFHDLYISQWHLRLRVMMYRKHVAHESRGAQEKTFAELKGEFALDVLPTRHYGANTAGQQLSVLAHNLIRSFSASFSPPGARFRSDVFRTVLEGSVV